MSTKARKFAPGDSVALDMGSLILWDNWHPLDVNITSVSDVKAEYIGLEPREQSSGRQHRHRIRLPFEVQYRLYGVRDIGEPKREICVITKRIKPWRQ